MLLNDSEFLLIKQESFKNKTKPERDSESVV